MVRRPPDGGRPIAESSDPGHQAEQFGVGEGLRAVQPTRICGMSSSRPVMYFVV
jgi:hypothetical protein